MKVEIGIEEDETLQQTELRRKLGFFGHVIRSDDARIRRWKEEERTTTEKMDG